MRYLQKFLHTTADVAEVCAVVTTSEAMINIQRVLQNIAQVSSFEGGRQARKSYPQHLPHERLVIEACAQCICCGSAQIINMGGDCTDTPNAIPYQGKLVQTMR